MPTAALAPVIVHDPIQAVYVPIAYGLVLEVLYDADGILAARWLMGCWMGAAEVGEA